MYNKSYEFGVLGCYLSGVGLIIMVFIDENNECFSNKFGEFLREEGLEWNILELFLDDVGVIIIEGMS